MQNRYKDSTIYGLTFVVQSCANHYTELKAYQMWKEVLSCIVWVLGIGWGVDGGWMPLPTRPPLYCDPASLVRRKITNFFLWGFASIFSVNYLKWHVLLGELLDFGKKDDDFHCVLFRFILCLIFLFFLYEMCNKNKNVIKRKFFSKTGLSKLLNIFIE